MQSLNRELPSKFVFRGFLDLGQIDQESLGFAGISGDFLGWPGIEKAVFLGVNHQQQDRDIRIRPALVLSSRDRVALAGQFFGRPHLDGDIVDAPVGIAKSDEEIVSEVGRRPREELGFQFLEEKLGEQFRPASDHFAF